MELKWYWKALILSCFALGFITPIPWSASRANFLGYYSFCSFVPFSTSVMFILAVVFYTFVTNHRKTLFVMLLILLMFFGFTGWWFYNLKLLMNSLKFSMSISYFWVGTTRFYDDEENASAISFYLMIHNPTDRDTPEFMIEPRHLYINDKKLVSGYSLSCLNGTSLWAGLQWFFNPKTVLKAHENLTLLIRASIRYNYIEVEDDTREIIWASLTQGNFTLGMSGILNVKPYFSQRYAYPTIEDTSVWAARLFVVSQNYG